MPKQKAPAIVAELGRPETPEETAKRKAENSRLYRKRKTLNNLVYSLLASLGLLLVIALLVPRGTGDYPDRNVDVQSIAKDQITTAGQPLAAPEMPDGWLAKQAQLRFDKEEQVSYWYVGYTTPSGDYASISQGWTTEMQPAGAKWVAQRLELKKSTGVTEFAGQVWDVYDHQTDSPDSSNVLYGVGTQVGKSNLVVSGTAAPDDIRLLAERAVTDLVSPKEQQ